MKFLSPPKDFGFTLVELLVVITISSMAVALVGGLGVQEYKKYQVKAEQLELKSFLSQISHKAFVYELPMILNFKQHGVQVLSLDKKNLDDISFEFISFNDEVISLNKQGFYSNRLLQYKSLDKVRTMTLSSIVHEK